MKGPYYLRGVATLELDRGKCDGCGTCVDVCPQAVLALEDRRARIADLDACMECGACAKNCKRGALTVSAGVGCANALINAALGRTDAPCCGPSGGGAGGCCGA